jgi:uncharacterized OB-fold protein
MAKSSNACCAPSMKIQLSPELPGIRALPVLTALNSFFWTGGRTGRLAILRCDSCGEWIHPPSHLCPVCLSRSMTPREVSGLGTIETFTINHQPWTAELSVPYVIAIVSLNDCPSVRLTTNVVGCTPDSVRIGAPVRVIFVQLDDVRLPLFSPV